MDLILVLLAASIICGIYAENVPQVNEVSEPTNSNNNTRHPRHSSMEQSEEFKQHYKPHIFNYDDAEQQDHLQLRYTTQQRADIKNLVKIWENNSGQFLNNTDKSLESNEAVQLPPAIETVENVEISNPSIRAKTGKDIQSIQPQKWRTSDPRTVHPTPTKEKFLDQHQDIDSVELERLVNQIEIMRNSYTRPKKETQRNVTMWQKVPTTSNEKSVDRIDHHSAEALDRDDAPTFAQIIYVPTSALGIDTHLVPIPENKEKQQGNIVALNALIGQNPQDQLNGLQQLLNQPEKNTAGNPIIQGPRPFQINTGDFQVHIDSGASRGFPVKQVLEFPLHTDLGASKSLPLKQVFEFPVHTDSGASKGLPVKQVFDFSAHTESSASKDSPVKQQVFEFPVHTDSNSSKETKQSFTSTEPSHEAILKATQNLGSPIQTSELAKIQAQLDASAAERARDVLAKAQQDAMAHVEAQHKAIMDAQQQAEREAFAKIEAQNGGTVQASHSLMNPHLATVSPNPAVTLISVPVTAYGNIVHQPQALPLKADHVKYSNVVHQPQALPLKADPVTYGNVVHQPQVLRTYSVFPSPQPQQKLPTLSDVVSRNNNNHKNNFNNNNYNSNNNKKTNNKSRTPFHQPHKTEIIQITPADAITNKEIQQLQKFPDPTITSESRKNKIQASSQNTQHVILPYTSKQRNEGLTLLHAQRGILEQSRGKTKSNSQTQKANAPVKQNPVSTFTFTQKHPLTLPSQGEKIRLKPQKENLFARPYFFKSGQYTPEVYQQFVLNTHQQRPSSGAKQVKREEQIDVSNKNSYSSLYPDVANLRRKYCKICYYRLNNRKNLTETTSFTGDNLYLNRNGSSLWLFHTIGYTQKNHKRLLLCSLCMTPYTVLKQYVINHSKREIVKRSANDNQANVGDTSNSDNFNVSSRSGDTHYYLYGSERAAFEDDSLQENSGSSTEKKVSNNKEALSMSRALPLQLSSPHSQCKCRRRFRRAALDLDNDDEYADSDYYTVDDKVEAEDVEDYDRIDDSVRISSETSQFGSSQQIDLHNTHDDTSERLENIQALPLTNRECRYKRKPDHYSRKPVNKPLSYSSYHHNKPHIDTVKKPDLYHIGEVSFRANHVKHRYPPVAFTAPDILHTPKSVLEDIPIKLQQPPGNVIVINNINDVQEAKSTLPYVKRPRPHKHYGNMRYKKHRQRDAYSAGHKRRTPQRLSKITNKINAAFHKIHSHHTHHS